MAILPDVLQPGLKVVFCGTAPGDASAKAKAYYAGPGNKFWPTLYRMGFTPRQLKPEEYRKVLEFGIGLTDLAKNHFGSDKRLPLGAFDREGLRDKILRFSPGVLAFTSKRGAQEFLGRAVSYGFQREKIGCTAIYVLPSPSGAACGFWDEACWQELADWVQEFNK